MSRDAVEQNYQQAKERFAHYGVDTDSAIDDLERMPVSMNCWQADDVVGFEGADSISGGVILATGNSPGRARNAEELRSDASINRITAWVVGMRGTIKSLLAGLLKPLSQMRDAEQAGDLGTRLTIMEELKTLPIGAVWEMLCLRNDTPLGGAWIDEVKRYEREVLTKRG